MLLNARNMMKRTCGWTCVLLLLMAVMLTGSSLFAQNSKEAKGAGAAADSAGLGSMEYVYWGIALFGSLLALYFARHFYVLMLKADEGTEKMKEIAEKVRIGARAYLYQQYKIVAVFFVIIGLLLAVASFVLDVQSKFVPFAFLSGGLFSGLSGFIGMRTATAASSRTAAGAQKSLNQGLQVAFRSGAVMGLTVVGLGLLDIVLWYGILRFIVGESQGMGLVEITVVMLCFGMGASSQALFARVGGGIFTKAADVGADLVGKVEAGIPEDDPRNPAVIADNVGDNVGDVAGMGADLYESYCGSILAAAALGVAAFSSGQLIESMGLSGSVEAWQLRALFLPMLIAAVGCGLSILGIFLVRTEENASQKTLLKALARGIDASTIGVILFSFLLTWMVMGFETRFLGIACSVVVGLAAGWLIGKWTEYCTSNDYKPTIELAGQALTGPATVIIGGIAEGMKSTWAPVVIVCFATLLSYGSATGFNFADVEFFALGLYGVGIAAVGMLSTLGITLATDAYGPIADNAGGNAEMSHLGPEVRQRTDALDCLGNTTAATGKGFAIGSAALTALALMAAYVEEVRVGFERWKDDTTVVQKDAAPGWYKVNDQFVVEVTADKDTHGAQVRHGWLIFPDDSRKDSWRAIDASKGPAPLPASAERLKVHADSTHQRVFLAERSKERAEKLGNAYSEIDLIEVKHATLPDFVRYYDASLMNPKVLVGVFMGMMSVFLFCALTMKAVGRAAKGMVEEVRRQFRENPGIMAGTSEPDYAAPVAISTKAAQWEMILPSMLALILPVGAGILLGVGGVLGLLVGATAGGFCVAVFMANSGGAWDNAKKYIEQGNLGGKGSDAHKAAVVGDTVGDPFKDTSGPSLNILIKLMSMVSVVAAGLVVRYSLLALGIF